MLKLFGLRRAAPICKPAGKLHCSNDGRPAARSRVPPGLSPRSLRLLTLGCLAFLCCPSSAQTNCVFFNTSGLDSPTVAQFELGYKWLYVFTSSASGGSVRSSITVLSAASGATVGTYDFLPGYLDVRVMDTSDSGQYLYLWGRQTYQTPCSVSANPDRPVYMRIDTGAAGAVAPFAGGGPRQTLVYGDPIRQLSDLTIFQRIDGTDYAVVGFAGASSALEVVKLGTSAVPASFIYTTAKTLVVGATQRPVVGLNNAVFSALRSLLRPAFSLGVGSSCFCVPTICSRPLSPLSFVFICLAAMQRSSVSSLRIPRSATTRTLWTRACCTSTIRT